MTLLHNSLASMGSASASNAYPSTCIGSACAAGAGDESVVLPGTDGENGGGTGLNSSRRPPKSFAERAQERDRNKLSLPERTKADWPLYTRGRFLSAVAGFQLVGEL